MFTVLPELEYPHTAASHEGYVGKVNQIFIHHSQGVMSLDVLLEKAGGTRPELLDAIQRMGYYHDGSRVYRCSKYINRAFPMYRIHIVGA